MQSESKQVPDGHESRAERLIVLLILDHSCTRAELDEQLHDVDSAAIDAALDALEAHGVVAVEAERVSPSRCARRLDALGLISL